MYFDFEYYWRVVKHVWSLNEWKGRQAMLFKLLVLIPITTVFNGLCFLLDYLFTGVAALVRKPKFLRLVVGCWFAGLLAIDGVLLFYGDGQTMGPRCQLLLNEERDFLRGYYLDLYDTCQIIKRTSPQAVLACDKFHTRIVRHYTGLETYFPGYAPEVDFDLFLEVQGVKFSEAMPSILQDELERPPILAGRLINPQTQGKITVWQVD